VSGLHIASALLTKYKGPEIEKPVIRPYTPVSDEGKPSADSASEVPLLMLHKTRRDSWIYW
jgi:hypothetical protein